MYILCNSNVMTQLHKRYSLYPIEYPECLQSAAVLFFPFRSIPLGLSTYPHRHLICAIHAEARIPRAAISTRPFQQRQVHASSGTITVPLSHGQPCTRVHSQATAPGVRGPWRPHKSTRPTRSRAPATLPVLSGERTRSPRVLRTVVLPRPLRSSQYSRCPAAPSGPCTRSSRSTSSSAPASITATLLGAALDASKMPQRCLKDTAHKCQLIQHRSTVCKASPHGQHQSTSFSTGSISAFSVQDPSIRAVGSRRSRASNICTGLSHQHRQTCVNIHLLLDFVLRPRHQHGTRCAALALMYFLRGELVIRCVAALPIYAGVSDVPLRHLSWNEPRGGLVQPPSQTTSTPPHDQPPHPRPRVRQSHFILRLHVPALGRSQLQPERQPWGLVQTRGLHSFTSELNFSSSMTRS
jgi:hypothetical protein